MLGSLFGRRVAGLMLKAYLRKEITPVDLRRKTTFAHYRV
jgi:hypothetical protein